jgi:hypothetical protein
MSDISNFSNTSDYLPIITGVLITDMLVILLLVLGIIKSKSLKEWYDKYNLSAVLCDVLIIVIGIIIARFAYSYIFSEFSLIKFIILAVGIQIVHDLLFALLFNSIPYGTNKMIDTFKDYGKEVGFKAVIADSSMMIVSCVLASYLAKQSTNTNVITLIGSAYLLPYLIYNN